MSFVNLVCCVCVVDALFVVCCFVDRCSLLVVCRLLFVGRCLLVVDNCVLSVVL